MSYHFHFLPTTRHKILNLNLGFDGQIKRLNKFYCHWTVKIVFIKLFLISLGSTIELNKIEEVTERFEERENVKTSKQNQTVEMFFIPKIYQKAFFRFYFHSWMCCCCREVATFNTQREGKRKEESSFPDSNTNESFGLGKW